jgi:hypothetical protein
MLIAASLSAQQWTDTSPKGVLTTEGNATFFHWGANRRFQQLDRTHVGTPRLIRSVAWRRDGNGGGATAVAMTLDLEVKLGNAKSWTLIDGKFDNNFRTTPTIVFSKKQVNVPDWTQAPPMPPAAHDFVALFDGATIFVYTGVDPLIIDFTCENPSLTTGRTMDRDFGQPTWGFSSSLGAGCQVTGRASTFAHSIRMENGGPLLPATGMHMQVSGTNAPSVGPVFLSIAANDANLGIPGLCTNLRAAPGILLPLAMAEANGDVPGVMLQFPYAVALQGATIYTQLYSIDPGQTGIPVSLSNGAATVMPSTFPATTHDCIYLWITLPLNYANFIFPGGGAVIRLQSP